MRSAPVSVACDACGGSALLVGWVSDEAAGLAVHNMHVHRGGRIERMPAWVVTHLRSGLVVGAGYETRARAEAALLLLGSMPVDWGEPYERLQAPELVAAIRDVVARSAGLDTGLGDL